MNTTVNPITSTPSGHRNKRETVVKKRYRRNHATSTTSIPKTTKPAGTPPRVKGLVQDNKKELGTISVEPALEAGHTYVIDMEFTGLLLGSLYGFYRSSYKGKNGTIEYVVSESLEFDPMLRFVDQGGS
jgi:hypothetical protein